MNVDAEQQPAHRQDCIVVLNIQECPACAWLAEREAEMLAWQRFVSLWRNVPYNMAQPYGFGRG